MSLLMGDGGGAPVQTWVITVVRTMVIPMLITMVITMVIRMVRTMVIIHVGTGARPPCPIKSDICNGGVWGSRAVLWGS